MPIYINPMFTYAVYRCPRRYVITESFVFCDRLETNMLKKFPIVKAPAALSPVRGLARTVTYMMTCNVDRLGIFVKSEWAPHLLEEI